MSKAATAPGVELGADQQRGRAWLEPVAPLLLLLGACLLWWLGAANVAPALQLVLWGCWLAALVVLNQLGYLPLFGPVFFYDLVRTARRKRYLLMRSLYAFFLLAMLLWVYNLVALSGLDARAQAARLAEHFFETLMLVQLGAVLLLMPAYMGGAVAEEKERRTLEFILATDLRNREIILSKLGSRLANLALFLLTGLPILSFLQFLGGIDPNLVLMGFAVTGLTMLGSGSVTLLCSVLMRRARDAIGATYLFHLAYFFAAAIFWTIGATIGWRGWLSKWFDAPLLDWVADGFAWVTDVLNAGSPLALSIRVAQSAAAGTLAETLPGLLRDYATFHLALAVLCLTWATWRLRTVGLQQTVARTIQPRRAPRHSRSIGEQPMLWKEMLENARPLGWGAWLGLMTIAAFTLGIGMWIWAEHVLRSTRHSPLPEVMNVWARVTGGAVVFLTLLRTAVRASSSISGERDQQTFDALITTQLDSSAILGAKLLGSVLSVRLGFFWLAAILLLACITGGVHPVALLLTLAGWIVYAFCFAAIGLYFSMRCANSTRAAVSTVMTSVGLALGHWLLWMCIGPLFAVTRVSSSLTELILKVELAMSPPIVLIAFMFRAQDLQGSGGEFAKFVTYGFVGMLVWGITAIAFWHTSLSPRFRTLMRRTDCRPEGAPVRR